MISINSTPKTIIPVTELEQSAFCQTEGNLRTKTLEQEFQSGVRWQKVPTRYLKMTPEQVEAGIRYARKEIGTKAVVLGHHYQRDDVIQLPISVATITALETGRCARKRSGSSSAASTSWPKLRTCSAMKIRSDTSDMAAGC